MNWLEFLKFSTATAVPLLMVIGLFFGMLQWSLGSIKSEMVAGFNRVESELASLKDNVHGLDVRLVRIEERIPREWAFLDEESLGK